VAISSLSLGNRRFPWLDPFQAEFPFDQGPWPEILAVQVQQVERKEQAFPPTEHQVIEYRSARIIDSGDLTVDDGILDAQVLSDPLCQFFEVAESVPIP
jgi:hypothetical protein